MRFDGQKHVFHEKELFSLTLCAVVFDGPVGEQAPPEDGSVELGKLGELEESRLLQKLQEMIRADPEKAENLYEKFREILKAEKREDLICSHCPLLNHQDKKMIKSGFLASGSLKERHIRGVRMRKVAKKEKNQNIKSILYWNEAYGSTEYGFCCGQEPYERFKVIRYCKVVFRFRHKIKSLKVL